MGWGGVIYTLTHLGVLWNEPALLDEAEAAVERLTALIEQDARLDLMMGSSGAIAALLGLYRCRPAAATLAAAVRCGDHLLARAQETEHGIGWVNSLASNEPLAGFSHGAAGIAWALLELAAVSGEERFREAALAGIAHERALFVPEAGNWLDLRTDESGGHAEGASHEAAMCAWCHGAPGVGLGRLLSLRHLDDETAREEIDVALKTTLERGFGDNHSLCHGDLGNLELPLQASLMLGDPQWRAQVDRLGCLILDSISRDGCLCGVPAALEVPGLMTGIAGIGYQLLRLAEPGRVPSVLWLEPPPEE
jgi:type 2 lantibiotic biosynthesis protein LanM